MKKSLLGILLPASLSLAPLTAFSDGHVPVAVPETGSTLILAAIGLAGVGLLVRRIKRGK